MPTGFLGITGEAAARFLSKRFSLATQAQNENRPEEVTCGPEFSFFGTGSSVLSVTSDEQDESIFSLTKIQAENKTKFMTFIVDIGSQES